MARVAKFTDEQKFEIALDLLAGKMSHAGICRKWDISSTYAYKLKDRAVELLRQSIGKPVGRPTNEDERLRKKVADLEPLAGGEGGARWQYHLVVGVSGVVGLKHVWYGVKIP